MVKSVNFYTVFKKSSRGNFDRDFGVDVAGYAVIVIVFGTMISGKLKGFRKTIEDVREGKEHALEAIRKDLTSIPYIPELAKLDHLRSLTLSHNKITEIPQEISSLQTLEHLNLFNNCIVDISPKIVELTYLRSLNLG
ncbi:unnamed protein product [Schistosoma rodhaini]|uniref:Uncharacterized protein n=1 Tax=Schistosoma rodhaini TaxID=6188 RepID=A0AA85G0A2_9TREM|nr:unnamed protein product [Schistosoma rodhaini]